VPACGQKHFYALTYVSATNSEKPKVLSGAFGAFAVREARAQGEA